MIFVLISRLIDVWYDQNQNKDIIPTNAVRWSQKISSIPENSWETIMRLCSDEKNSFFNSPPRPTFIKKNGYTSCISSGSLYTSPSYEYFKRFKLIFFWYFYRSIILLHKQNFRRIMLPWKRFYDKVYKYFHINIFTLTYPPL